MASNRPYFMVLTLGLLGAGFFFTYRRPKVIQGGSCGCEHPRSNRLGQLLLWGATLLVVGFLAFPYLTVYLFG